MKFSEIAGTIEKYRIGIGSIFAVIGILFVFAAAESKVLVICGLLLILLAYFLTHIYQEAKDALAEIGALGDNEPVDKHTDDVKTHETP